MTSLRLTKEILIKLETALVDDIILLWNCIMVMTKNWGTIRFIFSTFLQAFLADQD